MYCYSGLGRLASQPPAWRRGRDRGLFLPHDVAPSGHSTAIQMLVQLEVPLIYDGERASQLRSHIKNNVFHLLLTVHLFVVSAELRRALPVSIPLFAPNSIQQRFVRIGRAEISTLRAASKPMTWPIVLVTDIVRGPHAFRPVSLKESIRMIRGQQRDLMRPTVLAPRSVCTTRPLEPQPSHAPQRPSHRQLHSMQEIISSLDKFLPVLHASCHGSSPCITFAHGPDVAIRAAI